MSVVDKTVLVSHLGDRVSHSDLARGFQPFGKVVKTVIRLNASGKPSGTAFVVFQVASQAKAAVDGGPIGDWIVDDVPEANISELHTCVQDQDIEATVVEAFGNLTPAGQRHALKALLGVSGDHVSGAVEVKKEPVSKTLFSTPSHKMQPAGAVSSPGSAMLHKMPKLPVFSGIKGKDSSFGRWKHEVKRLEEGPYDEYTILDAVHQSLKSPAADLLVTMGSNVTTDAILQKFASRYGSVLSGDAIMEKFYQEKQEGDCASWAFQLEDLIYQAVEKDALTANDVERKLRSRFWRGLREKRIKDATRQMWETMNFDALLVECRALEEEYGLTGASDSQQKPKVKMQQVTDGSNTDKLEQILKEMKKLGDRLDKLEQAKSSKSSEQKPAKCTKCKLDGHLYWGCRKDQDIECHRCHEKGHISKSCRKKLN